MRIILIAVLIVAFAAPLSAQDFNKGWAAYESGDYATALKEWKPLAQQGLAQAQFNLGKFYRFIKPEKSIRSNYLAWQSRL